MKVPTNKIDLFIKKPDSNIHAVLIYGSDYGLNYLRAETIHKAVIKDPKDLFSNFEFYYKDIKKDPAKFNDSLKAKSLFKSKKFFKILDCEPTITKSISDIIKSYRGDNFLVFMAEDLSPNSSLRKLFETESNLAAIACYKDDLATTKQLANNFLRENSYHASSEVIEAIAYNFSGNRLLLLNELEKLITYKGENHNITLDDIDLSVSNNVELSLENISNSFAAYNFSELDKSLQNAFDESVSPITIIRTIMYYFNRLYLVRCKMDSGISFDSAINILKPPIFFKNVPTFKNHVNAWNASKIINLLTSLQNLEQQCKNSKLPADILLKNFLFLMAYKLQK